MQFVSKNLGKDMTILSLGSNLGNSLSILRKGVERLGQYMRIQTVSSIYESSPVGMPKVPHPSVFYNLCMLVDVEYDPISLVNLCKQVEKQIGFGRSLCREKISRILDIDVILHQTHECVTTESIQIPHKEYYKRLFVLLPLLEIAPHAVDPQQKIPIGWFYQTGIFPGQICKKIASIETIR